MFYAAFIPKTASTLPTNVTISDDQQLPRIYDTQRTEVNIIIISMGPSNLVDAKDVGGNKKLNVLLKGLDHVV